MKAEEVTQESVALLSNSDLIEELIGFTEDVVINSNNLGPASREAFDARKARRIIQKQILERLEKNNLTVL